MQEELSPVAVAADESGHEKATASSTSSEDEGEDC